MINLKDFREIWVVHVEADQPEGECPRPRRLSARELRSGRLVRLDGSDLATGRPPYDLSSDSLFIAYHSPLALGCHLGLGWSLPARILDLCAEYRCLTAGLRKPEGTDIAEALDYFGFDLEAFPDPLDAPAVLLREMCEAIDLPRALLRGRYMAAVARMEAYGIPIDMPRFNWLRSDWQRLKTRLIEAVDDQYGAFQGTRLIPARWAAWCHHHDIPWKRLPGGKLDVSLNAFKEMAKVYPEVQPIKELWATLRQMNPLKLAVGADGRNRCGLNPFGGKTGRNQPSSNRFIFCAACWIRGLIKPAEGMAVAYVDWEQQEFGIAAALSGDVNMQEAYLSGDPYLEFAKQAGAVPTTATKESHPNEREQFKQCILGVQYGIGAESLALRLRNTQERAKELLALHRQTFSTYWEWSGAVQDFAFLHSRLQTVFGWTLHIGADAEAQKVRNFPLQANGAEMLRLACILATEAEVRVCAPVHDALLIEAPAGQIVDAVKTCQEIMQKASEVVLNGFRLRTDEEVYSYPQRFRDPRGAKLWKAVNRLRHVSR